MIQCQIVSPHCGRDGLDVLRELMVVRRLLCSSELLRLKRLYGEVPLSFPTKVSHHKSIYKCSCQLPGVVATLLKFSFSHLLFNHKATYTMSQWHGIWTVGFVICRKRQIGHCHLCRTAQSSPLQATAGQAEEKVVPNVEIRW